MKMILLSTALVVIYAPAFACGNGECGSQPGTPEVEQPETKPEPSPEPEPEPETPATEAPEPEAPTPEHGAPAPETPTAPDRQPMDGADRKSSCDGWLYARRNPEECDRTRGIVAGSLEVTDQAYHASEKWAAAETMPRVCERTWFTLRFSIPAGMTKDQARARCIDMLEDR